MKKLICLIKGHKWKLGMDGGICGFMGRQNIKTKQKQECKTCERCGRYWWLDVDDFDYDYWRTQAKKQGWKRFDGEKL